MTCVAIIGGGLAGTALAYCLKRAGAAPVIYEASDVLASGASGNEIGMVNPRISALRMPESDYFTAAFELALRTFQTLGDVDWDQCGALHLMTDERRRKQYPQTVKNWGWDPDRMRLVSAVEASEIAGIELQYDALWLPDAGAVSPRKLCAAYADGIDVRFGRKIEALDELEEEIIVLASSVATGAFEQTKDLPIKAVRGQVTQVNATHLSKHMKCNIHYGGYAAKPLAGVHVLGATFQPWLDHSKILPEDNQVNIDRLCEFIPALAGEYEVVGHRASVRAASKDHFPIVGHIPGHDHLYLSTAHGSHGIISALKSAELLTDMILGRPYCLPLDVIKILSAERFL